MFEDVGNELQGLCDQYSEGIYSDEFAVFKGNDVRHDQEKLKSRASDR